MEIPESAFISNMSMIIEDKEYVAKVEEKSKARSDYKEAIDRGYGAGEYFRGNYFNILEFVFSSHC